MNIVFTMINRSPHPDRLLIEQGVRKLNYISIPILPIPASAYTELCDTIKPGERYILNMDVRIHGSSWRYTDFILGLFRNRPEHHIPPDHTQIIRFADTITVGDLNSEWITVQTTLEPKEKYNYLQIGAGTMYDYIDLIHESPQNQGTQSGELRYLIDNVSLYHAALYDQTDLSLVLDFLRPGDSFPMQNILFDSNSAKLLSESLSELDQLVKYLIENPIIDIEIYEGLSSESVQNRLVHYKSLKPTDYASHALCRTERSERMSHRR